MKRPIKKNLQEDGWMGVKPFCISLILLSSLFISPNTLLSQSNQQAQIGQQFRLGEALIRIAEPGDLADTVNVWGDVGVTGRYLVPRGTNLTDIISYARGPSRFTTGETVFDRSAFRIELVVSRLDSSSREITHRFTYNYEDPLPENMRFFPVRNGDLVYIDSRRKPTFRDYVTVLSPTISLLLSTILLYDRAINN